MSVVAFDGIHIAADRQGTSGEYINRSTKIRRLLNGDVIAWTGTSENGLAVAQWYEAGADPALWPASQKGEDWSRLIVVSKGRVFTYEQLPIKRLIEDRFSAWGSGRDFALGALANGASAVEAVKVASKLSASCGMGFNSFRVR
jgi:ATP-dependent protease HslVU (ClpYQ) peptidase subunit